MKKSFFVILVIGLVGLSGFENEAPNFEQIAFDYFVSDILKTDFKDVTSIEFKGKTEESFSALGKFNFCLAPKEKLATIIDEAIKGKKRSAKEIEVKIVTGLNITDFQNSTTGQRLLIYPSVHVADNYYVFLSFQNQKEQPIKYVFELTQEGKISRSCKMD